MAILCASIAAQHLQCQRLIQWILRKIQPADRALAATILLNTQTDTVQNSLISFKRMDKAQKTTPPADTAAQVGLQGELADKIDLFYWHQARTHRDWMCKMI